MDRFAWILIVSTSLDALVAAGMLALAAAWAGRSRPAPTVTPSGVVLAVSVTTGVFVAKAALLGALGMRLFGLVHLVYLDGVIVLPLLGLGLLIASGTRCLRGRRVRLHPVVAMAAVVALLGAPVGVYATYIEPNNLVVERCEVGLPRLGSSASRPVEIAVLSDLQFRHVTDHEHLAVGMALAERPDIIVLPGDVFQGTDAEFERELPAIRKLLGRLEAPGGVFVVQGDCDSPDELRRAIEGTNVVLLYDEIVETYVDGVTIAIGGTRREYWSPEAIATARRLSAAGGDVGVRLLISHRPGIALEIPKDNAIDLVICGHTHGGQVCVPFVGPLVTATKIPRAAAAGGLSRVNGSLLYISRGVGCERGEAPALRFLCPPEVSLLSLTGGVPRELASRD